MSQNCDVDEKEYTTEMFRRWFQASLVAGLKDLDLVVAQYFRLARRRGVGKPNVTKLTVDRQKARTPQSAERSFTPEETQDRIASAVAFLLDQKGMKHKLMLDYSHASRCRLERLIRACVKAQVDIARHFHNPITSADNE